MSAEYAPGTIAVATVRGVEGVRVMRSARAWFSSAPINAISEHLQDVVADIRPLVVLDPEDREQVARLADAFCTARWSHIGTQDECDPLTRRSMKEALDAYLAPPKPAEPTGLGAVVVDAEGGRWVRACDCVSTDSDEADWRRVDCDDVDRPAIRGWSNIAAVRVLSKGVTD